jgi:hypothetical protein
VNGRFKIENSPTFTNAFAPKLVSRPHWICAGVCAVFLSAVYCASWPVSRNLATRVAPCGSTSETFSTCSQKKVRKTFSGFAEIGRDSLTGSGNALISSIRYVGHTKTGPRCTRICLPIYQGDRIEWIFVLWGIVYLGHCFENNKRSPKFSGYFFPKVKVVH